MSVSSVGSVVTGAARRAATALLAVMVGLVSGLLAVSLGKKSVVIIPGLVAVAAMFAVPYSALYSLIAVTPVNIEIVGPITVARLVIVLGFMVTAFQVISRWIPPPQFLNWPEGFIATAFFSWLLFATVAIGKGDIIARYGPFIIYAYTYFLIMNYVNTTARLRTVLTVLVAMGVIEALLGQAEAHLGFQPFAGSGAHEILAEGRSEGEVRVTGTTAHPIAFAGYFQSVIAAAITLALTARTKGEAALFLLLVPLFLATWYLTFSRSSWIGMGVMTFTGMLMLSRVTRWMAIIGGIVGFALLYTHDFSPSAVVRSLESLASVSKVQTTAGLASGSESLQWRFENWETAWTIFKEYPVFGIGLDLSIYSVLNYLPLGATAHEYIEPAVPHNMFLLILAEGGLLSFVLFIIIWIIAIRGLIRAASLPELRVYAGGIFAILVGLTGIYFFNPMPRVIWLALALCVAMGRIAKAIQGVPGGSVSEP